MVQAGTGIFHWVSFLRALHILFTVLCSADLLRRWGTLLPPGFCIGVVGSGAAC